MMKSMKIWPAAMELALLLGLLVAGGCGRGDQASKQPPPREPETTPDVQAKIPEVVVKVRPSHEHAAFRERVAERTAMVSKQIAQRAFAQPVKDQKVLEAMRMVPRHVFVPQRYQGQAYADRPLQIGYGQTISQPYIVGYMTELLELDEESKVLEIGTGSGYQAAVAAELAGRVYSIEIIKALGESGRRRLKELGYKNVQVKVADGYYGWPEKGPFEAIIVTAASSHIPGPLIEQLKPGGRLVIPLGSAWRAQELVLLSKGADGTITSRGVMGVRFVPMVGKAQE